MPKAPPKAAQASGPTPHRYHTRAAAKIKEEEIVSQETSPQTPRGKKPSTTGKRHPVPDGDVKGKARQRVATPPSAMRNPATSAPKPYSRVTFAPTPENHVIACSDDGQTDADGEYEVEDDAKDDAKDDVKDDVKDGATDADGDTEMGNGDRDAEVEDSDEIDARKHWGQRKPVGGGIRRKAARRGVQPPQSPQAGPAVPELNQLHQEPPVQNHTLEDLTFSDLWKEPLFPAIDSDREPSVPHPQPWSDQLPQVGTHQQHVAPAYDAFAGMMNQQSFDADYQAFACGMLDQPPLDGADQAFFDQFIGAGQQVVGGGAEQWMMGAVNPPQADIGAGNLHTMGLDNGSFVGAAAYENAGDLWAEGLRHFDSTAGQNLMPTGNPPFLQNDANFEIEHMLAAIVPPPEFMEQAPVTPATQPAAGNAYLQSPPLFAQALGDSVQPRAGPSNSQRAGHDAHLAAGPSNWQNTQQNGSAPRESTVPQRTAVGTSGRQAKISDAARNFDFGPRVRRDRQPHGRRYRREDGTWVDEIEDADPIYGLTMMSGGRAPFNMDRVKEIQWRLKFNN